MAEAGKIGMGLGWIGMAGWEELRVVLNLEALECIVGGREGMEEGIKPLLDLRQDTNSR